MKKRIALSLVFIIALALSACATTDTEVTTTTLAPTITEASTSTEVIIDEKTKEELKVLSESVKNLEALYNELLPVAKSNGWEKSELFIKEINATAAMIQVDKEIINDPSMLEGDSAKEMIDGTNEMATEWDTNMREKLSNTYK